MSPVFIYESLCDWFLQGTGKTTLVNKFAAMLGYSVEPIVMYQVSGSLVPRLSPAVSNLGILRM